MGDDGGNEYVFSSLSPSGLVSCVFRSSGAPGERLLLIASSAGGWGLHWLLAKEERCRRLVSGRVEPVEFGLGRNTRGPHVVRVVLGMVADTSDFFCLGPEADDERAPKRARLGGTVVRLEQLLYLYPARVTGEA